MKNRVRIIGFLLAFASLAAALFSAAPASATAIYCSCKFPNSPEGNLCADNYVLGGQLNLNDLPADLTAWEDETTTKCTDLCNATRMPGFNIPLLGFHGNGSTSNNSFCNVTPGADLSCKTAALPNPQSSFKCNFCYCNMGNKFPADCRGKTTFLNVVGSPSDCADFCNLANFDGGDGSDEQPSLRCDFDPKTCQYRGGPDSCKTAAQATANAKASAIAQASQGSVVSLPLPMGARDIPTIIGSVINRVLGVVGAIAFLMFTYGGFSWMLAAGNEERIKHARQIIVWAALGMVVIFAAYGITKAVLQVTSSA